MCYRVQSIIINHLEVIVLFFSCHEVDLPEGDTVVIVSVCLLNNCLGVFAGLFHNGKIVSQ